MSGLRQAIDRHFVAPLKDEEQKDVKRKALEANLKVKQWIQIAILEKLKRED